MHILKYIFICIRTLILIISAEAMFFFYLIEVHQYNN